MLVKEVILENFMSYQYARVPLRPGVNVVCGPNGSGKSSFLLGICVALGESYTERSRKLSDLIRWDEDIARVTLVLDNTARLDGERPAPQFNSDDIRLTRALRKDGKYWFELNNKGVLRYEVVNLLSRFGFDPDNMLVIMHQNVPGQFAAISPQEKLKTLEKAVGFESYRADVLEARKRLGGILSEEEALNQLISQATETLSHWKEQFERLQEKRNLQKRSAFTQRELGWARVAEIESSISKIEQEAKALETNIQQKRSSLETERTGVAATQSKLEELRRSWMNTLDNRIELERATAMYEYAINAAKENANTIGNIQVFSEKGLRQLDDKIETLLSRLSRMDTLPPEVARLFSEIRAERSDTFTRLTSELKSLILARDKTRELDQMLASVSEGASKAANEMDSLQKELDSENSRYLGHRIQTALLESLLEQLDERLGNVRTLLTNEATKLSDAQAEALIRGPRVDTGRSIDEILNEIRRIGGQLLAMSAVTDEAEEMFNSYSQLFQSLQDKIRQVRDSRRKVMEEIEIRKKRWLDVVRDLLDRVNIRYQSLLERLQATGEVRLVNALDVEEAGLELVVGFKGARQMTLDAYTHSGGERSTAVMAFLLALQQSILSPFRAIDEFDVHMDPRNREIVSDFIVSSMKGLDTQYLVITPSQVSFDDRDAHMIVVNKAGAISAVSVVA